MWVLVEGHDEHRGRTITARGLLVNLGQCLCRLAHIDMLLLQVLGRRSQPSCLQNGVELFFTDLMRCVELLAGVPASC